MITGCQIWGGTFRGPVDTTLEAEKPISDIDAVTPPTPTATTRLLINEKGPTVPPSINLMILTDPVMFRISSRPQAPASRSAPSTQFRKGRRPGHNRRKHYAIFKELAPFRNWVLGADGMAGAWGRDEIRNIKGAALVGWLPDSPSSFSGALSPFKLGNAAYSIGAGSAIYNSIRFDASKEVNTGPQNVPQHIWQPIILYLGRPK